MGLSSTGSCGFESHDYYQLQERRTILQINQIPMYSCFLIFFLQADQRVLRQLITSYLPDADLVLKEHDIGK